MSKHEDRAGKLRARIHETIHYNGGRLKSFFSEVDKLSVTAEPTGSIVVFFSYSDGSETRTTFEPGTHVPEMARQAQHAANMHCREIRAIADREDARKEERAARAAAPPLGKRKGDIRFDAREYAARRAAKAEADYRQALKARITEALLVHQPDRVRTEREGQRGVLVECAVCDFESFTPYPASKGLELAFADHQADVVLDLL